MATGRAKASGMRHQARTLALQALFEVDLTEHDIKSVTRRYADDLDLPEPLRRHVERLIDGVRAHQTDIDAAIATAAPAFPVEQLSAVDRNILRIAIYELRHEPDVPVKAVINEAVELAKHFGGDSSSRFVNGVLGTVARGLGTRGDDRSGASPV